MRWHAGEIVQNQVRNYLMKMKIYVKSETFLISDTTQQLRCKMFSLILTIKFHFYFTQRYGVSLTSGQPVTIVQKFPDLLQQVVFEVCE